MSPRQSAVEGLESNLVGCSPNGWQQPAKWNTFLDPTNDRQSWLPYKQCRILAWKVSHRVANGLNVSRSEAFRAVQLVLLRARKRLYEYHTKGPWMTMVVDVIEQIRNWKAETSKYTVHPLTDLCKLSCKALLRDGLHHAPVCVVLVRLEPREGNRSP